MQRVSTAPNFPFSLNHSPVVNVTISTRIVPTQFCFGPSLLSRRLCFCRNDRTRGTGQYARIGQCAGVAMVVMAMMMVPMMVVVVVVMMVMMLLGLFCIALHAIHVGLFQDSNGIDHPVGLSKFIRIVLNPGHAACLESSA